MHRAMQAMSEARRSPLEIAELLEQARADWSLDERAIAERAGLDLEDARAALRGEADVSDLADVARALGGTLEDVLAGRRFWEAPAVAFSSAPVESDRHVVRETILRLSVAARDRASLAALLELPGVDLARDGKLEPSAPRGEVASQAEDLARRARAVLGNEREPIVSVRAEMRRLGVPTFLADFGTDKVDGMAWRGLDGCPFVAANVRARGGKFSALRMTFGHELCHVLFDGTKLASFGLVERRSDYGDSLEQRANAFAAYFLAPRETVRRFLRERRWREGERPWPADIRALSEYFGMGVEAIAAHLVNCEVWGAEDMRRYRSLKTRDAAGEDDAELHPTDAEAQIACERRGELLDLATLALERGEISIGRFRELVALRRDDDWRALLEERDVAIDVEHRTM